MSRVVLCFNLKPGYEILKKIIEKSYFKEIILFTYEDQQNIPLINLAKANGIYTYKQNIKLFKKEIINFQPDYLFSIYYKDIIENEILKFVRFTSINLHPSLLPRHRGCFSSPWAILDGDKFTGITYHQMIEKVDTGKIYLQKSLEIKKNDTAFSLYNKLIDLGVSSFDELYEKVILESYEGYEQVENGSFHYRRVPHNGYINPDWNLNYTDKFIRAMYFPPYKRAVFIYKGSEYEFSSTNEFLNFCRKNNIILK